MLRVYELRELFEAVTTLVQRWVTGAYVHRNPLILLAVFLFLLVIPVLLLNIRRFRREV